MSFLKHLGQRNYIKVLTITALLLTLFVFRNYRDWTSREVNLSDNLKPNRTTNYESLFSPPTSLTAQCVQEVSKEHPGKLVVEFSKPQDIDGLSIFFPGYLQIESYYPKKFSVVVVNSNNQRLSVADVNNYANSFLC